MSETPQNTATVNGKLLPHQLPHPNKPGRAVHPKPKHFKVAEAIAKGTPMSQALLEAGYSEATAHCASYNISTTPALVAAIRHELSHYQHTPGERAAIIRQRLMKAVLTSNDANAIRACEVAGKDREVRLFDPDTQVNVLNMTIPAGLLDATDGAGESVESA